MEKNKRTRRKFILGIGFLPFLAAIGIKFPTKKTTLSCAPEDRKRTIKMLTQDGSLVEVDQDMVTAQRKKISDEELKGWVKRQ